MDGLMNGGTVCYSCVCACVCVCVCVWKWSQIRNGEEEEEQRLEEEEQEDQEKITFSRPGYNFTGLDLFQSRVHCFWTSSELRSHTVGTCRLLLFPIGQPCTADRGVEGWGAV
jgi:hypothetical protein